MDYTEKRANIMLTKNEIERLRWALNRSMSAHRSFYFEQADGALRLMEADLVMDERLRRVSAENDIIVGSQNFLDDESRRHAEWYVKKLKESGSVIAEG